MQNNKFENLSDYFYKCSSITIFEDGAETIFVKGDDKYEEIISSLLKITKDAREMPAYGVSLDKETRLARNSGIWLELIFDNTTIYNEMPFDSLLIEINAKYSGFNVIRKVNEKYEGRCFYLNIINTMEPLEKLILNISKNN